MSFWETCKTGALNVAKNAFSDNDGDFCSGTALGITTGLTMLGAFIYHGSTDYNAIATAECLIIAAIAAKRFSERK